MPSFRGWATHLFQVTITVLPNGSGDTTFNYVKFFASRSSPRRWRPVWTLLDRRKRTELSAASTNGYASTSATRWRRS